MNFELETKNDTETGVINILKSGKIISLENRLTLSKQTHIIAANIDQVFLLVTINNPPTFTSFIDRFLVTAEAYSIRTILLFNKIDTYNDDALL